MVKTIKERFVVENKRNSTYVDVEVIERATQADIERESEEVELELDDIDMIQLGDSSPTLVAQAPARLNPLSRAQQNNSQAMVLFPQRKTPHEAEALATIISSIPSTRSMPVRSHKMSFRLLSYVAVAAVSILGTWLVIGLQNPDRQRNDFTPASTLRVSDQTLEVPTSPPIPAPKPPEPESPSPPTGPQTISKRENRAQSETTSPDNRWEDKKEDQNTDRTNGKRTPSTNSAHISAPSIEHDAENEHDAEKSPKQQRIEPHIHPDTTDEEIVEPDAHPIKQILPIKPAVTPQYESLPKSLVKETLDDLKPYVQKCKGTVRGRLVVELIVSGATGNVISSKPIDQVEVGATTAQCVAGVVKMARFPTFEKSILKIKYPYDIQ